LTPTPELEAEINKPTMGGQARLIASGLRRLVPKLSKNKVTLVFINQLRVNIMGGQYNPYSLPGGMSLGFYLSLRIEIKRAGWLKGGDDNIGQEVRFVIKKNKCHNRNGDGTYRYFFTGEFDAQGDLFDYAVERGLITKEGNTYFYQGVKLAVGKDKSMAAINENPSILSEVRELLLQQPQSSE
jgi:recombination protein RecA